MKLVDVEYEQAFYKAGIEQLNKGPQAKWENIKSLKKLNGIYALRKAGDIVYIGSARDIQNRWTHHKNKNGSALLEKIEDYTKEPAAIYLQDCTIQDIPVSISRSELEDYLIKLYNPLFNNYRRKKNKSIL